MISNDLVYDPKLTASAKALYCYLASVAQLHPRRICKIGIRTMQTVLKIGSGHTINNLLLILETEGWLIKEEKINGRCNTYYIPFNKKCIGTDAKIEVPPLHSVPPININTDIFEDLELIKWNQQQLNN